MKWYFYLKQDSLPCSSANGLQSWMPTFHCLSCCFLPPRVTPLSSRIAGIWQFWIIEIDLRRASIHKIINYYYVTVGTSSVQAPLNLNCSIQVADDWIWTLVFWYWKRLRCQLSHNHCHLIYVYDLCTYSSLDCDHKTSIHLATLASHLDDG